MKRFITNIAKAGKPSSNKKQRVHYSICKRTDINMAKKGTDSGAKSRDYVTADDILDWNKYQKEWNYKSYKYLFEYFCGHGKLLEVKAEAMPDLNSKISLFQGDITKLKIDAIVNAANNSLLGGGGVDGCIHSKAGPELRKECALLKGCSTGDAKITKGHNLPAKHIIHTVGPIGKKPDVLKSCYEKCLEILKDQKLTAVAFCCISTGIYGYPNEDAAHVALQTTREWLQTEDNASLVNRIIFCVFLPVDYDIYERLIPLYFPSDLDTQNRKKVMDDAEKEKQDSAHKSSTKKGKERGSNKEKEADSELPKRTEESEDIKQESAEESCVEKGKEQDSEKDLKTSLE